MLVQHMKNILTNFKSKFEDMYVTHQNAPQV